MKRAFAFFILLIILISVANFQLLAQTAEKKQTDSNTPLHLLKPAYEVPYGTIQTDDVKKVLDRVLVYLEKESPARMLDAATKQTITDFTKLKEDAIFDRGAFRIISYEWGVTYSGMLRAAETTGDTRYSKYATDRMEFISGVLSYYKAKFAKAPKENPLRAVIDPQALDDAGAMCMAMIKTQPLTKSDLRPMIDHLVDYIMNKEFRLPDGTLARNRPQPNTLWLDDLYMSLPALVQMGKLTGDQKYFDETVKQLKLFADRMFVDEKGLFLHGWVQAMEPHRAFHWGRANGWAFLTMAEILDVLPKNHPGYEFVLNLFRKHAEGLSKYQSGKGFWHQLLDKNDSYLETSATAIYTYCYAHGINKGWLDQVAYGPVAVLGWNAVSTKVNQLGQVEDVCVGTGMGFDPAFYYYRPVNVFAAHGYGPVLLAGAEIIQLVKTHKAEFNDSSMQFYK